MKLFEALFLRELKRIASDSDMRLILLVAPLFYSLFYGAAYFLKTPEKIPVVVVDADRSSMSMQLIRNIYAHKSLDIGAVVSDKENGAGLMKARDVSGIVYIPEGWERDTKLHKPASVKLYLDNTRFLLSNEINRAMNDIKSEYDLRGRLLYLTSSGLSNSAAAGSAIPLILDTNPLGNTQESYGDFLIPGLLLLILQQTLLIGLGESIGKEREENSLAAMIPGKNRLAISLFAKVLPYLFIYSFYALAVSAIIFPLFSVSSANGILLLIAFFISALAAQAAFGLFAASFFRSKLMALIILAFSSYPFFLISGYAFPADSLPLILRLAGYIIPGAPVLASADRLLLPGASFSDFIPLFLHILALCTIYAGLAYLRFRRLSTLQIQTNSLNINRS